METFSLRLDHRGRSARGVHALITSSDSEYKATKRIKQGKARLAPPFDELAEWIAATWDVTVLNVIYDPANELHAPRLQVIVEHQHDAESFRDGLNFDATKQQAIKSRFLDTITTQRSQHKERRTLPWPIRLLQRFAKSSSPVEGDDTDGLFVVFSAFAPIATEEANGKLSAQAIEALQNRLGNPDLWVISRCFGQVTFMFYTDEQAARHEANGKKEDYAGEYFEILKPNDEFGYLSVMDFVVRFDSKQNFDDNYESNWYYYK